MKVYSVGQNSAVGQLITEIERVATEKRLTVSRWQANKPGRRVTVTWAIHHGERAAYSAKQENVIGMITLSAMEGTTPRCEAYRGLSKLLTAVNNA